MKKYEIQGVIGMGAYGVVLKAIEKVTNSVGKIKFYNYNNINININIKWQSKNLKKAILIQSLKKYL